MKVSWASPRPALGPEPCGKKGEDRPLVAANQLPVGGLPAGPRQEHHLLVARARRHSAGVQPHARPACQGSCRRTTFSADASLGRAVTRFRRPEKRAVRRGVSPRSRPPTICSTASSASISTERWRRYAVGPARLGARAPTESISTSAPGTLDFGRPARRPGFRGRVMGADFVRPMLDLAGNKAGRRPRYCRRSGTAIPGLGVRWRDGRLGTCDLVDLAGFAEGAAATPGAARDPGMTLPPSRGSVGVTSPFPANHAKPWGG